MSNKRIKIEKNSDGTVFVNISDIVRDKKFQGRTRLDKKVLKTYMLMYLRGQEFDPVEITQVNQVLILTDGWHRVRASELAGKQKIKAVIKEGDEKQAFFNAITANLRHGLQVKQADKRLLFRMYMDSGQYRKGNYTKSFREIAGDFNNLISHMTVKRWIQKEYRFTYQMWYSRQDEGTGNIHSSGVQEWEVSEEPKTFFEIIEKAIDKIQLVFPNIQDEKERGKLIWELESTLQLVKQEKKFKPYSVLDDEF